MRCFKKVIIICIIIVFIILSYFKFYTVRVSFSHDPTVAIVKTENIQWFSNTYKIEKELISYNWYDDYGFEIIYADEMGNIWQTIHSIGIIIWWIMAIYIVFNLKKIIDKKLI